MKKFIIFLSVFGLFLVSAAAQADTGVVKWYQPAKGVGFVIPHNGGDLLLLQSFYIRSPAEGFGLEAGACVSYTPARTRAGKLVATEVVQIECP